LSGRFLSVQPTVSMTNPVQITVTIMHNNRREATSSTSEALFLERSLMYLCSQDYQIKKGVNPLLDLHLFAAACKYTLIRPCHRAG
jgi:hypothetical protein